MNRGIAMNGRPKKLDAKQRASAREPATHEVAPASEHARVDEELRAQVASLAEENAAVYEALAARDRALAELRDAVRQRDSFVASMSHDLKSPLTSIRMQAHLLRDRVERLQLSSDDRLLAGLTSIDSVATKMTSMLNELLDVVRLQSGRPLELALRPTDLVALARQAVLDCQQLTDEYSFQLASDGAAVVGFWDGARLERVLMNLLSNAMKYSPGGGDVEVAVGRENQGARAVALLSVRDHGMGIPAADLPLVFQRFHRASNVVSHIPGVGLGLAGAQHIVERHGGTISVESREGSGSTFLVRLPLPRSSDPAGFAATSDRD
ncbi:MAG: HAMP domain-containing histidine kinase [Chloroflexi bacterium]|nr:HAMP domain-containing histidine kinase [Chloroflexota bacterium]